ncbi:unnamed protein product [Bursaphelenchus xylophilus]|uniref:General transcription factor IIH subunit 3 n=1 Tax=Bursaphelenchus xylophilus TaxID=6326 RepID=A0A1I7SSH0_BURXY|nr:unnamed protein product [Bursaphelenchus xylophilus]CAG9097559.1 unnamed protein product [Bursaphelenchus xylophilus]
MSCSIVVVDCNSSSWGQLIEKWGSDKLLKKVIGSLIILANSHLPLSAGNRMLLVAAGSCLQNKVLFSSEFISKSVSVASEIDANIRKAIEMSARSSESFTHTNYSSSFALAVCHYNRFKRENPKADGRIIVLNMSPESHAEQSKLMNLFLGAQQQNLCIHVASLSLTNPMLRQASDVTGGVHREIQTVDDLPDFFTRYCLGNSKEAQDAFAIKNFEKIDYQASCFCHNRPVSLGFVCSVCLAVHCQYIPICVACGTAFKVARKK